MSTVTITTAEKIMKTAPNLYGIFLEDINRAVDGGLYPELIRNRSFEDSILPAECTSVEDGYAFVSESGWRDEFNGGEGLSKWLRENKVEKTKIPAWYTENAVMELDDRKTLNKNRQVSLKVCLAPSGLLKNTGFCGIPQIKGEEYRFYMFAAAETPVEITVAVEGKEGRQDYGKLLVSGSEFTCYSLNSVSDIFTAEGTLVLSSKEGGEFWIGFISLMPGDTFEGHGLRKDIVEKLKAISPRFFRFPGGCIVEGFTLSTAMRFKNTVGPVWERPGHQLMWHYRSYDAIGFHEYLQLCEDLDMEPLYVCNCGMTCQARKEVLMEGEMQDEMLQDMLDAIEYAIGPADTKWGSLRAAMGHPAPFKLNYLEIGNENWGPAYEERYLRWYNTIKENYPHITCIANSHLEQSGLPAEIVDEHYYNTAEYFTENTEFFNSYDRKGPEIFLGEVSVVRGYTEQLYGALAEAAYFTGVEKNQDVVTMVSYAPLLENVKYQSWSPNLIRFDNYRSMGIPSYYVWKMFGSSRGDYVVKEETQSGRIFRPVKGIASLHGKAGIRCKEPLFNGKPVPLTHELMGHLKKEQDTVTVLAPDEEQKKESARYYGMKPDEVFLIFGEEESCKGKFEMQIYTEPSGEYQIGCFPYRLPDQTYISDETNPPKPWNIENVKPFLWKVSGTRSELTDTMGGSPWPVLLEEKEVGLWEEAGWHTFSIETDLEKMKFCVDGVAVHEKEVPSSPVISSVATVTEDEIILKLVNIATEAEPVKITLDCRVESSYTADILTGEKRQMNSLDTPEAVSDRQKLLSGASESFVYEAPALSVNILKLKKSK